MKEFQKIDWKIYNRPPFYQQWLCRDDTLKLASFGDRGLAEVDDQIRALKDQWDLDTVKGHFLDRIGKLLNEKRNGNTDAHYRILLKLRRLLNTNDGSIPSIIKALKFFYSSEVVHIVPDYPAGLIIEHDGEGNPWLNFNKLLAEIIPAGVSFSTKELFYFIDELLSNDAYKTRVRYKTAESVSGQIYRNGRILRNGRTDRGIERKPFFHNGNVKRNGTATHKPYYYTIAISIIKAPFRHSSGIRDPLKIILKIDDCADRLLGRLLHNGAVKRDGRVKHNGISDTSASEIMSYFTAAMQISELLPSDESGKIAVSKNMSDSMPKDLRHNGKIIRNGKTYHTGKAVEIIHLHYSLTNFEDAAAGLLYHNGSIKRDGSETHKATGSRLAYETIFIAAHINISESMPSTESNKINVCDYMSDVFEKDLLHNGKIIRNGKTYRSRKPLEKPLLHYTIAGFEDTCAGLLYHNGLIKRDRSETHKRTGNSPVYERFSIGIRKYHFHNGVYRHNGEIKHDSMVFIPLE